MAPTFKEAHFEILYNEGISKLGELIDLGVDNGIVDKSGAWFAYKGDKIGQGKENARNYLRERPEVAAEVEAAIRAKLNPERAEREAARSEERRVGEECVRTGRSRGAAYP